MATLILVHSPLVGPLTWQPVAAILHRRGQGALTPELPSATRTGPFWQQQASSVARQVNAAVAREPIVLAGHSGAGVLLPAIRAALGRPVAGYLFVDAGLPEDGQTRLGEGSFADALRALYAAGGAFPNWSEQDLAGVVPDPELRRRLVADLRPQPWAFWEEPIPVFAGWPDAPCGYLRFGDNPAYTEAAARARSAGWPCRRLAGEHFHMLVAPEQVADALLELAGELGVPAAAAPA